MIREDAKAVFFDLKFNDGVHSGNWLGEKVSFTEGVPLKNSIRGGLVSEKGKISCVAGIEKQLESFGDL